jgi:H+/gluconate symporter-like permease
VGLLGILAGLCLLIWLAYRGWSVLLLAPVAALLAALFAGEPLLAHWTQTFMGSAGRFVAQFFPLFLLGAVFAKLMEDSGSVSVIAKFMAQRLGASSSASSMSAPTVLTVTKRIVDRRRASQIASASAASFLLRFT